MKCKWCNKKHAENYKYCSEKCYYKYWRWMRVFGEYTFDDSPIESLPVIPRSQPYSVPTSSKDAELVESPEWKKERRIEEDLKTLRRFRFENARHEFIVEMNEWISKEEFSVIYNNGMC